VPKGGKGLKVPGELFNRMASGLEWNGFTTNCNNCCCNFIFQVDGLFKITNIRMHAYSLFWDIDGRNRKPVAEVLLLNSGVCDWTKELNN